MGVLLYVLGAGQIAIGLLILLGGWVVGGNITEGSDLIGGTAGLLFVGVLGGAFTMMLTGLVTIAVGSIYKGVRRIEQQINIEIRPFRQEPGL